MQPTEVKVRPYRKIPVKILMRMQTIKSGHFDDLKFVEDGNHYFVSRMTLEDGEKHAVTIEQKHGGTMIPVCHYGRPFTYEERFGS